MFNVRLVSVRLAGLAGMIFVGLMATLSLTIDTVPISLNVGGFQLLDYRWQPDVFTTYTSVLGVAIMLIGSVVEYIFGEDVEAAEVGGIG
jgi:hypothetical protein